MGSCKWMHISGAFDSVIFGVSSQYPQFTEEELGNDVELGKIQVKHIAKSKTNKELLKTINKLVKKYLETQWSKDPSIGPNGSLSKREIRETLMRHEGYCDQMEEIIDDATGHNERTRRRNWKKAERRPIGQLSQRLDQLSQHPGGK